MDFGSKIQMLRKNHGLSQEKLAAILKVNRNYLSRIETGKSEPTLTVIREIAKYFHVDVSSLLDLSSSCRNREEKIKKITEDCHSLLEDDLDFIIRIICVMKEEYVKSRY